MYMYLQHLHVHMQTFTYVFTCIVYTTGKKSGSLYTKMWYLYIVGLFVLLKYFFFSFCFLIASHFSTKGN